MSMEENLSPTPDQPSEPNTVDRLLATQDKKHLLIQASSSSSKDKPLFHLETSKLTVPPATTTATTGTEAPTNEDTDTTIATLTSTSLPNDLTAQIATPLAFLPRDNLIFLSRTFEICSWRVSFRAHGSTTTTTTPPAPAAPPHRPAAPPHANTSPTTSSPSAQQLPYRASSSTATSTSSSPSQRPPLKGYNTTTGANARSAIAGGGAPLGSTNVKALFPLPGDWISRDCLALCVIWARERSLLCPRNGEVGVVRCGGLV